MREDLRFVRAARETARADRRAQLHLDLRQTAGDFALGLKLGLLLTIVLVAIRFWPTIAATLEGLAR
jgi:hypothetical protein